MKIRPLHDRILVKRLEEETKTSGGLFIPDSAKEKPIQAKVIAVGSGKRDSGARGCRVGGITADSVRDAPGLAERRGRRTQARRVPVDEDQTAALGGQRAGDGEAKAGRAARDEPDLARETHHLPSNWSRPGRNDCGVCSPE